MQEKPHLEVMVRFRRTANYFLRSVGNGSTVKWTTKRRVVCLVAVLCGWALAIPVTAQQQPLPEDPEDEKQIGLWLDQVISTALSPNTSLEASPMSDSTRERRTCSSTSFRVVLPFVCGPGSH